MAQSRETTTLSGRTAEAQAFFNYVRKKVTRALAIVGAFAMPIGTSACDGDSLPPNVIDVPASNGKMILPFSIDVDADSTDPSSGSPAPASVPLEVSIDGNLGTLTLGQEKMPAVVYNQSGPSPPYFPSVYEGIAVGMGKLVPFFVYCADGAATDVFYETTSGVPMTDVLVTGSCVTEAREFVAHVSLPATQLVVSVLPTGFEIAGANIQLDSAGNGWLMSLDERVDLLPFAVVDCSSCEPGLPWYEIHTLLHTHGGAAYVILYLFPNDHEHVSIYHGIELPALDNPLGDVMFDATWGGGPMTDGGAGNTPEDAAVRMRDAAMRMQDAAASSPRMNN